MPKKTRDLAHLVATINDISYEEAIRELRESHDFLVRCAQTALSRVSAEIPLWGINLKRTEVKLGESVRPKYITKDSEKLGEVINMTATVERLVAALEWFAIQPGYRNLRGYPGMISCILRYLNGIAFIEGSGLNFLSIR